MHKDALIRYLLVLGMEPIFEKVIEGLDTKEEALDLENLIIRRIGTLELGTGPLVNVEGTGRRRKRRKRAIDVMFEMKDCAA